LYIEKYHFAILVRVTKVVSINYATQTWRKQLRIESNNMIIFCGKYTIAENSQNAYNK